MKGDAVVGKEAGGMRAVFIRMEVGGHECAFWILPLDRLIKTVHCLSPLNHAMCGHYISVDALRSSNLD